MARMPPPEDVLGRWLESLRRARPSTALVFPILAYYGGETGEAWPSAGTIAEIARVSRRAVNDELQRLVDSGSIEVLHPQNTYRDPATGKVRRTVTYRVWCEATFTPNAGEGVKLDVARCEAERREGVKPPSHKQELNENVTSSSSSSSVGTTSRRPPKATPGEDEDLQCAMLGCTNPRDGAKYCRLHMSLQNAMRRVSNAKFGSPHKRSGRGRQNKDGALCSRPGCYQSRYVENGFEYAECAHHVREAQRRVAKATAALNPR